VRDVWQGCSPKCENPMLQDPGDTAVIFPKSLHALFVWFERETLVYRTLLQLCVGRFLRRGQGADLQGLAGSDEFQTRHESSLTQLITVSHAGCGREVTGR
jgi:hypothetical protein